MGITLKLQCNHSCSYKRKAKAVSQRSSNLMMEGEIGVIHFEGGERGQEPKWPLEAVKGRCSHRASRRN